MYKTGLAHNWKFLLSFFYLILFNKISYEIFPE